jgi:ATP-dependent RNA helicase DDX10/DBP4
MPKKKHSTAVPREQRKLKLEEEIASLNARIGSEAPASGYAPHLTETVAFAALPLSSLTLQGLLEHSKTKPFTTMTAIQNACIPHALAGRDILGAARTGR